MMGMSVDYYSIREEKYDLLFRDMPSMMAFWPKDNYSRICMDGQFGSGQFSDFQKGKDIWEVQLSTSSIQEMRGWYLYGKFGFTAGRKTDISENLQFYLPDDGNPFYYFCQQPGDWNYQQYHVEGAFSKDVIKHKLYLGLSVDYHGDLAFRFMDTRNEEYDFTYRLVPSLTWRINKIFALGFSYGFNRMKSQPNFTNKFPENATDNKYNVYLNAGMGTYVKNISTSTETVAYGHQGFFSLSTFLGKNRIDLQYSIGGRNSIVSALYNSTFIEKEARIGRHLSMNNNVTVNHTYDGENLSVDTFFDMEVTNGSSNLYNDEGIEPEHFMTSRLNAILSNRTEFLHGPVSDCGISLGFKRNHDIDLKYGQEMRTARLLTSAECNLCIAIGHSSLNIITGIDVGYDACISRYHEIRSAEGNLYTERIAVKRFAFETTDILHSTISLGLGHNIKKGAFIYLFSADWLKPTSLKDQYLLTKLKISYAF